MKKTGCYPTPSIIKKKKITFPIYTFRYLLVVVKYLTITIVTYV